MKSSLHPFQLIALCDFAGILSLSKTKFNHIIRKMFKQHFILFVIYYKEALSNTVSVNILVIRRLLFQDPIVRDIKTTVIIKNILFATFSHTYQLLLYLVDATM